MLNNIDLAQVKQYEAEIKADDNEALFTTRMTGTWQFDENGPQFTQWHMVCSGSVGVLQQLS